MPDVGDPDPAHVDIDALGDHEGGEQPDAELADGLHREPPVLERRAALTGSAAPDDGEELLDVLPIHAAAVVLETDGAGLGVGEDPDRAGELRLVGLTEPDAVVGVLHQLPHEDIRLRIQALRQQPHQPVEAGAHLVGMSISRCVLRAGCRARLPSPDRSGLQWQTVPEPRRLAKKSIPASSGSKSSGP